MTQHRQNTQPTVSSTSTATPPVRKPNEAGFVSVEAHVKIFDPASREVFVEKRA
jgi:hypothetical protein